MGSNLLKIKSKLTCSINLILKQLPGPLCYIGTQLSSC